MKKPPADFFWRAVKALVRVTLSDSFRIRSKATQYLPRTWHSPTFRPNGWFGRKRNSVLLDAVMVVEICV